MPGDPFYATAEWRALRSKALKRDRYTCQMCTADLRKLGSSRVDHIKSRRQRPDLSLVLSNLRSLCVACDNRQSREKLEHRDGPRFERVDASGMTAAWQHELAKVRKP